MGKRADHDSVEYIPRYARRDGEYAPLTHEFSERFVDLMRAAMLTSYHKYGAVAEAYPERVKALASLKVRLDKYAETGNAEYLVDVANFAMIEFMHPALASAYYIATSDADSPGRVLANEAIYDRPEQFKNSDIADRDERPF